MGYVKENENNITKQMMYPTDLTEGGGSLNHFVMINLNTANGSSFKTTNDQFVTNDDSIQNQFGDVPILQSAGSSTLRNSLGSGFVRTDLSILLPMPVTVQTNYGMQWNANELGFAGELSQVIGGITEDNWKNVLASRSKEVFERIVLGAADSVVPGDLKKAFEIRRGKKRNPYTELMFEAVTNREFQFSWDLASNTRKESKIIKEILRRIKHIAHPTYEGAGGAGGAYIRQGGSIDISFMYIDDTSGDAKINKWLPRISTCVINSIANDYTSQGGYYVFDDNSPVSTKLDLTLTEVEPLSAKRFEDEDNPF